MLNKIVLEDVQDILTEKLPWEKFKSKSILITGANGFLPAYLAYVFIYLNKTLNFDIQLFLLCRNETKAAIKFADFIDEPFINLIIQDVSKPITINENIDIIIHAASQASPKYYYILVQVRCMVQAMPPVSL